MNTKVLYGLFTRLKEAGIPLGTRDYVDGLRAVWYCRDKLFRLQDLHDGSISPQRLSTGTGHYIFRRRNALIWICQALWAKSEAEKSTIARVITEEIRPADNELTFALLELMDAPNPISDIEFDFIEPEPVYPFQNKMDENLQIDSSKAAKQLTGEKQKTSDFRTRELMNATAGGSDSHFGVNPEYDPAHRNTELERKYDIPMPEPPAFDEKPDSNYLFLTAPEVSELWLLSLWRRLFVPKKKLDHNRIDVRKTVGRLCKTGYLLTPVMMEKRVNASSLLVFIDAGKNMSPWKGFEDILLKSLNSKLSGLKKANIYYFNEAPGKHVYEFPDLHKRVTVDTLFRDNSTSPVIIYSDAGAAGNRMTNRVSQRVDSFYRRAQIHGMRPLVWLNPMPKARWIEHWVNLCNRFSFVYTSELKKEALFQTVDLIRSIRR